MEEDNRIVELRNLLTYNENVIDNKSIMDYGTICDHDPAYLCECRVEWIIDYIKDNFLK